MSRALRAIAAVTLGILALAASPSAWALTIEDSRGAHRFAEPPQRIVALTWSLAEQLLELGVTPVGVADVAGYRNWVRRPPMPKSVTDVGLRQEPNIERVASLEPDLILAADDQLAFVPKLDGIAPVLHFDAFRADHDNAQHAREIYLALSELLDRQEVALAKLKELDAMLDTLSGKLVEHFGGQPPKVTIVRFLDTARVVVHGANSMPVAAMSALSLENGFPLPPSQWGITIKRVRDLGRVDEGVVLHIEPFEQLADLEDNPIWQAMPFVRADRFHALPPTWTYGGAMSIGYLAQEIADALLQIEPQ